MAADRDTLARCVVVLTWQCRCDLNYYIDGSGIFLSLYAAIVSKISMGDSSTVGWIPIMIVTALHGFNGECHNSHYHVFLVTVCH